MAAAPGLWRRTRAIRWLLVIVVFGFVVYSAGLLEQLGLSGSRVESFLAPEPHPELTTFTQLADGVPLAERFASYQDVDSVIKALGESGHDAVDRRYRKAEQSSKYPPYGFTTLHVADYRHLGEPGALTLEFFNDRLYQVEFVPKDAADYAKRQRALGLSRDRNARREKVEGDLRIVSTVDLAVSTVGVHMRTKPFILWQDLRLISQRDLWDQKFGAIPKSMVSG